MLRAVHPADRGDKAVAAAIRAGHPVGRRVPRGAVPDSVRWVMGKGEVLRDDAGRPVRLLEVNVDITDRKRADEALRASEEALRARLPLEARTRW